MRRIWKILVLALVACFLLAACGGEDPAPVYTYPTEETEAAVDHGSLTILFTGDAQNVFASDETQGAIGYAALAEYRNQLEDADQQVVLIDGGNALRNDGAGAVKNGKTLAELIGSVGYDIRVPGSGELSYGVEGLCDLTEKMEDCTYLSSNLIDGSGKSVFEPFVILECGEIKVGFVGITSPLGADVLEDENYGFCQGNSKEEFYGAVQDAIDAARDGGAAYVIAVSNLGTDPQNTPWTSAELIANTTGLSAVLDCGSGAVLVGNTVKDLDQYEIPICAPGSGFAYVGEITLNLNDGSADVKLLTALGKEDQNVAKKAEELQKNLE